jgi:hypothetical protein
VPTTTLPLDFPLLQDEARRLVIELQLLSLNAVGHWYMHEAGPPMVRAYALFLADLTRQESQNFWLRALAVKLNMEVGVQQPYLRYNSTCEDWSLHSPRMPDSLACYFAILKEGRTGPNVDRWTVRNWDLPMDADKLPEALYLILCDAFGVAP